MVNLWSSLGIVMCDSDLIIVNDKTKNKTRKLRIVTDLDETITADPEMWFELMAIPTPHYTTEQTKGLMELDEKV